MGNKQDRYDKLVEKYIIVNVVKRLRNQCFVKMGYVLQISQMSLRIR